MLNWCLFSRSELEKLLGTDFENGLSTSAALMRSTENDAAAKEIHDFFFPFITFLKCLGGMICDFSVLMLLASALFCRIFANTSASIVNIIIGFIFVCSLLRTLLILYSEKSVHDSTDDDLYKILRDGKIKKIKGRMLVRGDVVLLSKGDIAPCNLRLIESENLSVIEKYAGKRVKTVSKDAMFFPIKKIKDIPLRFQKNMVYEGSAVTSGNALAVVTDNGMTLSQARKIINIGEDVADCYIVRRKIVTSYETRLLKRSAFGTGEIKDEGYSEEKSITATVEKIASIMRICGLFAGTVMFAMGAVSKAELSNTFLTAVAVMSCAPSALYEICIASAFVAGGVRLKAQGVYIKNLECAEKLALSRNLLCCGSTCFNIDKMVAEACYIGRSLDFSEDNAKQLSRLCELLLCTSEVYYKTDKNGIRSLAGNLEGLAALEGARKIGVVPPGAEKKFIERLTEFHDINGSLIGSFCLYRGSTVIVTKGSVANVIKKCRYYDIDGTATLLENNMRERIYENAKSYENNESCRVVAVCYKQCDRADRNELKDGFIFAGFVVFDTRINYESEKYVSLLRKNGITPVIFANDVSDMVIRDAKKIGVLGKDDNYITSKSFSALDEKIYSDDLTSYTLYMGLGGLQKRAVVRNKKYSEKLVTVTAEKSADAFDMSECDVLISFGKYAPKTLKRISDIHSENVGIGVIYRTVCICRNMIRCTVLSSGYLIFAQIAAIVFCFCGMLASFFTSGALSLAVPQLYASIFLTDLIISVLTSFNETPSSIISDFPEAFMSYYRPEKIVPKAALAGIISGFTSFFAYLIGSMRLKSMVFGASCAVGVMYISKCLVSLFCIMRTSTRKAPTKFPFAASFVELIFGIVSTAFFGKDILKCKADFATVCICEVLSLISALITNLYVHIDER